MHDLNTDTLDNQNRFLRNRPCRGSAIFAHGPPLPPNFIRESPYFNTAIFDGYLQRRDESGSQVARILIADKHELVRSALREILNVHSDWQIVAEAADGNEAILKVIETKPDVVVIDDLLPLVSAVEVTRQIRARRRRTEVLVLSIDDSVARIEALLKAGARGYLKTQDAEAHIVEAVEFLAAHKPFFTARVSEALLELFLAKTERTRLSNRITLGNSAHR